MVGSKSFRTLNLADAVLDFVDSEPHVRVSFVLEDFSFRPYEFLEKGYDLALCIAAIGDSALISRTLASLDWVLCASPAYVAEHGRPRTPADLKRHSCLTHMNLEINDRMWPFSRNQRRHTVKVDGAVLSNSALVLRKAALRSFGVAILPRYYVAADLAAGRLVPLLSNYKLPNRPPVAVYPRAITAPHKINSFVAFLSRWFLRANPNHVVEPS